MSAQSALPSHTPTYLSGWSCPVLLSGLSVACPSPNWISNPLFRPPPPPEGATLLLPTNWHPSEPATRDLISHLPSPYPLSHTTHPGGSQCRPSLCRPVFRVYEDEHQQQHEHLVRDPKLCRPLPRGTGSRHRHKKKTTRPAGLARHKHPPIHPPRDTRITRPPILRVTHGTRTPALAWPRVPTHTRVQRQHPSPRHSFSPWPLHRPLHLGIFPSDP